MLTALVQNSIVGRMAEMAIAALWQGVLIAGALAICLSLVPRVSAAYRFAAWAAAFVVLVGLSLFSLVPLRSFGAAHTAAHVSGIAAGPLLDLDLRWSLAIVGLWAVVALVRAADLTIHSLRLRRLWKEAAPVALDERVAAVLDGADCRRGPVEVCTTKTLQRPSVIGFFRPRILIPDWLYARLTHGEMEQIVLHEAEHLRRRDDWTNLAQKLCLVVFPLNPALAWIERKLCKEREMACDEGVIRVTHAPRAYAACLASLAERGLERRVEALSLGAWHRRPELVHRVHSILRSRGGLNPVGARVLLGTLGCGLIAGSVELAQTPQLVAFVPESSAAMLNAQNSATAVANASVVAPAQHVMVRERRSKDAEGQFTAVNASLRQPAGIEALPAKAAKVTGELKAVPVMAKSQADEASSTQDQQWVVLTAWTQVETPNANRGSGIRSDYDLDANGNDDGQIQDQAPANRIMVTQLIFRVQPAVSGQPANSGSNSATMNAGAKSAANGKSNKTASPATSPSTIQPAIAAIRDGWLVLQL